MRRILRLTLTGALLAGTVLAQAVVPPIATHPRMLINDQIPDTWNPVTYPGGGTNGRLKALSDRMLSGVAGTDWTYHLASIAGASDISNGTTDSSIATMLSYIVGYQVFHRAGRDTEANPYAARMWTDLTTPGQHSRVLAKIDRIVTTGTIATVTLHSAPVPALTVASLIQVAGATDDALSSLYGGCGEYCITDFTIVDPLTITFATPAAAGTDTGPFMLLVNPLHAVDEDGFMGMHVSLWAYFYDGCYDWLVANGHDQFVRDEIKVGYWATTPTRGSSGYSNNVRESDFHNHAVWDFAAVVEAGLALYGDDPLGAVIVAEGAGYLWKGQPNIRPAGIVPESFIYNLKASVDTMTGGAFNWEGPQYWREAASNQMRMIEEFDTATGRANKLWTDQFSTAKNAGWYQIYTQRPDGIVAPFGDSGSGLTYQGRNNLGLVILNDRFPDSHFVWSMTSNPAGGGYVTFDSGKGVWLGLKLIFFPYVNGPGSHDFTDLPLAKKMGPDIVIRSGWGLTDTFITYTNSVRGVYHRYANAGDFSVFKRSLLVAGSTEDSIAPGSGNWSMHTVSANTMTIFDPNDCWKEKGAFCNQGNNDYLPLIINDGGQFGSSRRYFPPYTTAEYEINRIWSGSQYSGATAALADAVFPLADPLFTVGVGYEHIHHNMTSTYVNTYSGVGGNGVPPDYPSAKVAMGNGVMRDLVHFQTTQGTLDPVVTFDNVTSTNAGFVKSWNLHMVGVPSVNGTPMTPGDNTRTSATVTKSDNGTGRVYVNHILPVSSKVRVVGGDASTPIHILSCTTANPSVCYAPSHGLKVDERILVDTGTVRGGGSVWHLGGWSIDSSTFHWGVLAVPDADHFVPGSFDTVHFSRPLDGSALTPWATAFASGNGCPGGGACVNNACNQAVDATYYDLSSPVGGNTVWQCWDDSVWRNLYSLYGGTGYRAGLGYTSPVITSHSETNWHAYVDQYGPGTVATIPYNPATSYSHGATVLSGGISYASPGDGNLGNTPATSPASWAAYYPGVGVHLWDAFMFGAGSYAGEVLSDQWRISEQAPSANLNDLFLNVVTATTTAVNSAPVTSRITAVGVEGVLITNTAGYNVAVFSTNPAGISNMSYTTTHSGTALHVASGLTPGAATVTQGGITIATVTVDASNAVGFAETGGGAFAITVSGAPPFFPLVGATSSGAIIH